MNDKEWLNSLKPGDEAWISGRWSAGRIVHVTRLTATQIVIDGEGKFKRADGRAVGYSDGWSTHWLRPVTDDVRKSIEREGLASWLVSLAPKSKTVSLETLRAMKAAYDATQPEKAA